MPTTLDTAIAAALERGRVRNFIDSNEVDDLLRAAREDGVYSEAESNTIQLLLWRGFSHFADDLGGQSPELLAPTLSEPAWGKLVSGTWKLEEELPFGETERLAALGSSSLDLFEDPNHRPHTPWTPWSRRF